MSTAEGKLKQAIRIALTKAGYLMFSNLPSPSGPGRADYTVWGHGPVGLEMEVKTSTGTQLSSQVYHQTALDKRGVLYRVVRSVTEAKAACAEMDALNERLSNNCSNSKNNT